VTQIAKGTDVGEDQGNAKLIFIADGAKIEMEVFEG
jgi:hypothetical protein